MSELHELLHGREENGREKRREWERGWRQKEES